MFIKVLTCLFTCVLITTADAQRPESLSAWEEGYLDIHHINTARGNATFFIFPDGTSMLFDAGQKRVPIDKVEEYFNSPCDSMEAGELIAYYIKKMLSQREKPFLDYAVVSHFHNDHYGEIDSASDQSGRFNYKLSGITQVGDLIPIKILLDRGFPNYDHPVDTKSFYKDDITFQNYLTFIKVHTDNSNLKVQALKAGRKDQIILLKQKDKYANFYVRNIKVNDAVWTGVLDNVKLVPLPSYAITDHDENALSIALKISYGNFDYYTGGDNNGSTFWGGVDMETNMAPSIGKVEALALNHHGYFDASNKVFLETLCPQVIVHQVIHDPHFQAGVLDRVGQIKADLFTYNMHKSINEKIFNKRPSPYKSTRGHILIRVAPGGREYKVVILNDRGLTFNTLAEFGPYYCR